MTGYQGLKVLLGSPTGSSPKLAEKDVRVGVGQADSTPSLGKPSTWGSGLQF